MIITEEQQVQIAKKLAVVLEQVRAKRWRDAEELWSMEGRTETELKFLRAAHKQLLEQLWQEEFAQMFSIAMRGPKGTLQ